MQKTLKKAKSAAIAYKDPVATELPPPEEPAQKRRVSKNFKVFIDYPRQDEGVTSRQYTFRVGTGPAARHVEVSIDRGPWLACRQAVGFWWFDWADYGPGVHRVTARALTADGKAVLSQQRRFQAVCG